MRTPSLGARLVLRVLWAFGRVGLGAAFVRLYMWVLAAAGPRGMPMVFRGYRPTAHDVFVCTYAKSGTNWMMQIVVQIAHRGAAEFAHVHDLVPWPEAPVPSLVAQLSEPTHAHAPTGLRAVKTHVPAPWVPLADEARYIAVLRDPKDVFVSSFHFVGGITRGIWGAAPTLEDWWSRWTEGRFPLGSWAEHAAGWWALRDRPNVLVLTFGELVDDLPGCVDRVAAHLGVQLTPEERAAVVHRSTFAWMKAHADRFATPVPALIGERAIMIRAGQRGGSGALLTADQRRALDQRARDELATLGCDLPYDTLFVPEP